MLTAGEAAARLGIKRETLYAYVSRGRLRSVAVPGSRERHYRPEDIDGLRAGSGGPTGVPQAAGEAVMPMIDSAISLIEDERLYYRGHDAIRLSDTATLEDIARLLWGEFPDAEPRRPLPRGRILSPTGLAIIERCQLRLAMMAAEADPAAVEQTRGSIARAGHGILRELVACVTGRPGSALPVHRQLAAHWGLDAAGSDLLRRCLVLIADHELNASTFVARCVAGAGAGPCAVVSAALGALSGKRNGGAAVRAEALFHTLKRDGDPITAMAELLAGGEQLPGIGHPLYPDGDPRAVAILYAASALAPQARRLVNRRPNVDFALAAAAVLLGLPPGAALSLFVVGRTVGWIAHAIEQYESGVLIRPRARYTGPRPGGGIA
ncbi:MAG TPA: citrate synthase family protein [Stellaceae bacterium]